MAERLTLREAMRGYSEKVRTNKSTFAEGQGTKKILNTIGDEVIEASKYWKKNIEPNMKAWKDIEAGYDELGIDEADRWGGESFEGKRPNFITRMRNPDRFSISNVESDGKKFSVSGLRGLGRASKSADISTYEALAKSGQTDFKSLFAIQETPAVEEINKDASTLEALDTLEKESDITKITKTEVKIPTKKEKLNNNQIGNNDNNTPISNTPEVILTWETDPEYDAWWEK